MNTAELNSMDQKSAGPAECQWDLSRLYPSPENASRAKDVARVRDLSKEFQATYRGRISGASAEELLRAFQSEAQIHNTLAKLSVYAYLTFASDTESAANQALLGESEELGAEIGASIVFFDLEVGKSANAAEWLKSSILKEFHYPIQRSVERARHNLSEDLEAYGIEKSLTGQRALVSIFDELSGSITFEEETADGRTIFSQETALASLHSGDLAYRHRIYSKFLKTIGENKVVLSNVYNNIMLDHRLDCKRRGFEHVMDPRCIANQVSRKSVEGMIASVEKGYDLARRYFTWKADRLSLSGRFTNADIYAPITASKRSFTFEQAKDVVVTAYGRFHEQAGQSVMSFFDNERVDAVIKKGKRPGAFCYGASPELDAFVFMNFTGEVRSVQTLAHELGHGLHHQLAKRQNHLNFQTPLVTAETASVFGEILVNEYLLENSPDPVDQLSILAAQMEGVIATVFRQTVLTRFELAAHGERDKGRVSAERLCDIWWEENARLYGDAVKMVDAYRWGWAYIPHFVHTPFYCYAYSFGQLLVLALHQAYRQQGDSFKGSYLDLLACGGSASPRDIVLKTVGLDIDQTDFWDSAIDLVGRMMDRLDNLAHATPERSVGIGKA